MLQNVMVRAYYQKGGTMGAKRYFWLKLMGDFFDKTEIRLVEKAPNGKELVLLYLKLLCRSIESEGYLLFNGRPYSEEIISMITDTDPETVKIGISLFEQYGLIERKENTFFMPQIVDMMASETHWAELKRKQRERQTAQELDNVQGCPNASSGCQDNVNLLRDREEKDLEKDLEKDFIITDSKESVCRTEVQRVVEAWNSLQEVGITPISKMKSTSKRYRSLVARIREYGPDAVVEAIDKIRESDFLRGANSRGWVIVFDWFVKPNNFPKILEGNYDNRAEQQKTTTGDAKLDRLYNRVNEVDKWV